MSTAEDTDHAYLTLTRAIVEQAPDAVIFADREGRIRFWNHGAEQVFGHQAAEILGASLDIIIPEQLRRAHWEGFNRAIATGQGKYANRVLTTRSMHSNGNRLYVDLSFGLVRNESGTVIGALAIGRDATDRYLAEKALSARIAELEATKMRRP